MENLIKALQIFLKYQNRPFPTICIHGTLIVTGITKQEVSKEDRKKLNELSFFYDGTYDGWVSSKYGSA